VRKQNREADRSYEENYERTGHGEYHRREKYPKKWDVVHHDEYSDDDYYDDEHE
jgi:hypothetical protein